MPVHGKKIVVQVFAGGFGSPKVDFSIIKEKLDQLYRYIPIDCIIIGWCLDRKLYSQTLAYAHEKGTDVYLWFPVFSEVGQLIQMKPVVDWQGNEIASYQLQEGENFTFYCPSSFDNIENVQTVFRENFRDLRFDGVFLDKIRYPSFANGLNAVFTCCCVECTAKMKQQGINVLALRHNMEQIAGKKAISENPLGIRKYQDLWYHFENKLWDGFFAFKAARIENSVQTLSRFFSQQGLKVGLDVFAPFLGCFVGQRIERLLPFADFIKPMFYRTTFAPAGLPFELGKYAEALAGGTVSPSALSDAFKAVLGITAADSMFPIDFVLREIEALHSAGLRDSKALYPGFEINRLDPIAPVHPDYIAETLDALMRCDLGGLVLSWDVTSAPEDNIAAFINAIGQN